MKKQLIAQTPLGLIEGKKFECNKEEQEEMLSSLREMAEKGIHMTIETEEGDFILAREVIKNSIFFLKNIEE